MGVATKRRASKVTRGRRCQGPCAFCLAPEIKSFLFPWCPRGFSYSPSNGAAAKPLFFCVAEFILPNEYKNDKIFSSRYRKEPVLPYMFGAALQKEQVKKGQVCDSEAVT